MRTGPTNPVLRELISRLKKVSLEQGVNLWKRIASDLEKPTRGRRVVNLARINRCAKDAETVIIPGKVLGSGALDKKVKIAAFTFSKSALLKIKDANCQAYSIDKVVKENPKASKVRIIG